MKLLRLCSCAVAVAVLCFAQPSFAGKAQKVRLNDLPAAVQAAIKSNLNGGRIAEITRETKNGAPAYKAEVKGNDGKFYKVTVAEDGKLLEVKEDKHPKHKHLPLFG